MKQNLFLNLFDSILVLQDLPKYKVSENIIITINSLKDISKIPKGTKS